MTASPLTDDTPAPGSDCASAEVAALVEAITGSQPFQRNRISDPSQLECDVAAIHAKAFDQLVELAERSHQQKLGLGALLLGSSGTGKSHLLGRFSHWADQRGACFVFLHNIQVRPADMGRYLLKCCINRLVVDFRRQWNETQLFRMIEASIRQGAVAERIQRLGDDNYREVYQRLARRFGGEEAVFEILFQFYFHASKAVRSRSPEKRAEHAKRAGLAVRWLKGDLLDADEARLLERRLRADQEVYELDDGHVLSALLAIAKVALAGGRPMILGIDQVDNMSHDQLAALARALHVLIDHGQNLLVVVSGVFEDVRELIRLGVIHSAAADRLNHHRPIVLNRINRSEAKWLLQARAAQCLGDRVESPDAIPSVLETLRREDELFPLGSEWFALVEGGAPELRPRDVITWAADRWQSIQQAIRDRGAKQWLENWSGSLSPPVVSRDHVELVEAKVGEKVEEAMRGRHLHPDSLPADAGNLQRLTASLLRHCLQADPAYPLVSLEPDGNGAADLIARQVRGGQSWEDHVSFVVTGSRTSAASRLKRLLNSPNASRRILVTDAERMPLQLGERGEEYLAELQALGSDQFRHVELTFDQYARLDALLAVLGQARSGDLEVSTLPGTVHTVSESEVIACYHRRDEYRRHALLGLFL